MVDERNLNIHRYDIHYGIMMIHIFCALVEVGVMRAQSPCPQLKRQSMRIQAAD
jgi:hypothetical protein